MIIELIIFCLIVSVIIYLAMRKQNNTTTNFYIYSDEVDHIVCRACGKESPIELLAWCDCKCPHCGTNDDFKIIMKDGRILND